MNIKTLLHYALPVAALFLLHGAQANNIQVTNTTTTFNSGTQVTVQFDISWENSWRGGGVANWDAAWVFVKYRMPSGLWQHVRLATSGHTAPTGAVIAHQTMDPFYAHDAMINPVVGAFVHRDASGSGNWSVVGVQLAWDYGAYGINPIDIAEVRVYAIEMVYVPQGAFAIGTGGGEYQSFTLTTINTANAQTVPSGSGLLGGAAGGYPSGATPPTSALWPNGYGAFYCMKYEVSQQAYVDFLNTLTYTQQGARTASAPSSAAGTGALSVLNDNRNSLDIQVPGVVGITPARYACNIDGDGVFGEANDGTDIACNFMSWGDLGAYLDWSGLRHMTEMEFEKACRGTTLPLPGEHPWGQATVNNTIYNLVNSGQPTEQIGNGYSTTTGNVLMFQTSGFNSGPLRCGIFAGNAGNTGRVTAGASYYGIMEMAGNVLERTISLGNATGRTFLGANGNGDISASGTHTSPTWPPAATAEGAGFRGGSWVAPAQSILTSNRLDANNVIATRNLETGGRGVRSAP